MDEIQNFITELKLEGRMSDNTIRSYQTDLKKMLLYIIENHFVEKNVTQIYESLMKNKWDLDTTIYQLKNN